jgi:hypothetical protein
MLSQCTARIVVTIYTKKTKIVLKNLYHKVLLLVNRKQNINYQHKLTIIVDYIT